MIGRTKGSKKGRGGGCVRDRRRERENVKGLKRREGGKRWKMEQWEKLLLIFCLQYSYRLSYLFTVLTRFTSVCTIW